MQLPVFPLYNNGIAFSSAVWQRIRRKSPPKARNYKVSAQVLGLVISEIYRYDKDLTKPFRIANTNDMYAYKAISIDKVPKYTSAFTAITSDNADEAIAAAMTTKGHADSPLEKIVMA